MPLSKAAARKMLHIRTISIHGYQREDGLLDIEAHMTDMKTYNIDRQEIGLPAGELYHNMRLRITIDEGMNIMASEAAMDATPHSVCPGVAPNYQRLVGLKIGRGFLKTAMERLGGIQGCTHLRELLQQIGTTALQTILPLRNGDKEAPRAIPGPLLNTCYAYNENGALAERYRAEAQAK